MDDTDSKLIANAILMEVERRIQLIADEEIRRAQATVERRVRGELGQIATTIFSCVNFDRMGRDLRITVQIPERKEPGRG